MGNRTGEEIVIGSVIVPSKEGTPKDAVPDIAGPDEVNPASGGGDSATTTGASGDKPAPTPQDEPSKASRAGRNLPAALAVGFGLGIGVILLLLFAEKVFIGVLAVAMAIATWEVIKRLSEADVDVPRIPLLLGGQAVIWLAWPYETEGVVGAFAVTVAVVMVWRLFQHGTATAPRNFLRDTSIGIFVLAWIPLFAAMAILTLFADDGNLRILVFMIGVVCSDVGGYVAGVLFGKHPMVPTVSPKKSWEGFGGSLLFCIVGSVLAATLLLDADIAVGIVLGVALVLAATLGDLIESQVKRELQIKDMGTLLPGHGGIMDRLDSMLPAAVVSWLVFTVLL
nr:phosphatidate cytidylyltransferase [Aldersonia kunmingensis]